MTVTIPIAFDVRVFQFSLPLRQKSGLLIGLASLLAVRTTLHTLTHRRSHISGLSTRPHCSFFLRNSWTSAATMGDDDQLGCFPKSSGPPGAPPYNWQTYVGRRVTAEVNAALDERSRREEQFSRDLPPFPPVPPSVSLPVWALPPGSEGTDRPQLPRIMGTGSGSADRPGLLYPPAVLPPPPALLTLPATSSSLTIHDRDLANSLVRQGMENLLSSGTGSSTEPSMYRKRRGRSRSPVLRRVPHRA